MASNTFSNLPAEIHVSIAEHCENNDLISLCLTSKYMNRIYLRVLYHHVEVLRLGRSEKDYTLTNECHRISDARKRQGQFCHTLLSHPEYGKYVRCLKAMLYVPKLFYKDHHLHHLFGKDTISHEELWRAMQLLTHVRNVDVGSRDRYGYFEEVSMTQFPDKLFQSATLVRLAGLVPYGLAKSIVGAINPAMLEHLCFDMTQDRYYASACRIGTRAPITHDELPGLLMTLTGCCTALRTLVLRREGIPQYDGIDGWYEQQERFEAAEEASHVEWASFLSSVQGTLEKFTFEYSGRLENEIDGMNSNHSSNPFKDMGEKFRRLFLPVIVSGNWPCLRRINLRGVRSSDAELGKAGLKMELRTALDGRVKIMVKENVRFLSSEPWC